MSKLHYFHCYVDAVPFCLLCKFSDSFQFAIQLSAYSIIMIVLSKRLMHYIENYLNVTKFPRWKKTCSKQQVLVDFKECSWTVESVRKELYILIICWRMHQFYSVLALNWNWSPLTGIGHWCHFDGRLVAIGQYAVICSIVYGCMLHKAVILLPYVRVIKMRIR